MATFNINIQSATSPIANDDSYTIHPNTITIFNVTENDFLGITPSVISIEIQSIHGTVAVNGMNIEYTPTVGYVGNDSFYYKITDNNNNTDIGKVNLKIG